MRPRDRRPSSGDQFLKTFGKPQRLLNCACERSDEPTMAQAFQLISGAAINEMLAEKENRIGRMLQSGLANLQIVEELYWTALSRSPSREEQESAVAFLQRAKDRRAALEDLAWGLLNSPEFLLRT